MRESRHGVNGETFYSVRRQNGQLLSGGKKELLKAIAKDDIYAGSQLIGVRTSKSRDPINP